MRDRWILPASNPVHGARRTLPSHVAEAYGPNPSQKQGTRIDVYV